MDPRPRTPASAPKAQRARRSAAKAQRTRSPAGEVAPEAAASPATDPPAGAPRALATAPAASAPRAGKGRAKGPQPLADLARGLIAPHCRKRGIANLALLLDPADLFGARFAKAASVERIVWPRDEDGTATLVVAADGPAALALQHVAPQVVERANLIIGWSAIGRLRITQARRRPRRPAPPPLDPPPLDPATDAALNHRTSQISDDKLKAALLRLGQAVARRGLSNRSERP